jgi:hypothetical protein
MQKIRKFVNIGKRAIAIMKIVDIIMLAQLVAINSELYFVYLYILD